MAMRGIASRAGRCPKAPVHKIGGSRRSGRAGEPPEGVGVEIAGFGRGRTAAAPDRIRITGVERIHAVDRIAAGDSNQPRSGLASAVSAERGNRG